MNNQQTEEIYNQTFAGLSLFYRDTTLSDDLISTYKVGQILVERGFTDMSTLGGGLAGNLRYLIASAYAKDLSAIDPESALTGHVMLHSNAFFKVLDIYTIGEKTQIFLLEIPERSIGYFKSAVSDSEAELIKKGKQDFDILMTFDPVEELQTLDWKERTEFPIGMSDQGEFFYQESTITKDVNQ